MIARSFAQLFVLLLFILVALAALSGLLAFFNYLGEDAKAWATWLLAEAQTGLIQKIFAALGAVTTAVAGSLGIYKTWRFAEFNLPIRLQELLKRWERAENQSRSRIVPELGCHELVCTANRASPWRSLAMIFFDIDEATKRSLERSIGMRKSELGVLDRSRERCRNAITFDYLKLGSKARRANPDNPRVALNLFKKALDSNGSDCDALELAGRQAVEAGQCREAIAYFATLIEATREAADWRYARASRFKAEALFRSDPTVTERLEMRRLLEEAIRILEAHPIECKKTHELELGLTFEALARVHTKGGRLRLARNAITSAKRHLGDLDRLNDLERQARPPE